MKLYHVNFWTQMFSTTTLCWTCYSLVAWNCWWYIFRNALNSFDTTQSSNFTLWHLGCVRYLFLLNLPNGSILICLSFTPYVINTSARASLFTWIMIITAIHKAFSRKYAKHTLFLMSWKITIKLYNSKLFLYPPLPLAKGPMVILVIEYCKIFLPSHKKLCLQ